MTCNGIAVPRSPISKRFLNPLLLFILPLVGPSCVTRHHVSASPPTEAKAVALQGLASINILTGNTARSKYEEVIPPRPIGELTTPIYPDSALRANYGQAVVAVRVFLDASGQVTGIQDAPSSPSTSGRFAVEFRSAVEDAIHQWRFEAAEYRQYSEGKDLNGDGKPDYMVVIARERVPVYFDVRFDFSIVKGHGHVK